MYYTHTSTLSPRTGVTRRMWTLTVNAQTGKTNQPQEATRTSHMHEASKSTDKRGAGKGRGLTMDSVYLLNVVYIK